MPRCRAILFSSPPVSSGIRLAASPVLHVAAAATASLIDPAMALVARSPLSLLLVAAVLLCSGTGEARVLLTLDDFGAVGDGIANDTQAFLDAWAAACASAEQAVLAVPAGKFYRIWPVQLAGPCKEKLKLLVRTCVTHVH